MADAKISALPSATTPMAGTEVVPIVQSGTTKKVSLVDLLKNLFYLDFTNGRVGVGVTPQAPFQVNTATNKNVVVTGGYAGLYTSIRAGNDAFNAYTGLQMESTHLALNGESGNGVSVGTMSDPGAGNFSIGPGNLIFGTAAKGVNFTANTPAANMTSQLLNWYEEGTWTPVVSENGSGTNPFTAGTVAARYTRIGRAVTLQCSYQYTSRGSFNLSNFAFMTGMPFTQAGAEGTFYITIEQSAFDTKTYYGYVSGNNLVFRYDNGGGALYNGGASAMTGADFPAAATVRFSATYFV